MTFDLWLSAFWDITPTATPNQPQMNAIIAADLPEYVFYEVSTVTELKNVFFEARHFNPVSTHVVLMHPGHYVFTYADSENLTTMMWLNQGKVMLIGVDSYNAGLHPADPNLPDNLKVILERSPDAPQADFFNTSGTLTLYNIILRNGGGPARWGGGGIINANYLNLYNSVIEGSVAYGVGGAVYNQGQVIAINTIFQNNTTGNSAWGGAFYSKSGASSMLACVTFKNNAGGAIYRTGSGQVITNNSNFMGNTASGGYAAIQNAVTSVMDAQHNWWNRTGGPLTAYGAADAVSANVNTANFLSGEHSLSCNVPPAPTYIPTPTPTPEICQPAGAMSSRSSDGAAVAPAACVVTIIPPTSLTPTSTLTPIENELLTKYRIKLVYPDPSNPADPNSGWTTSQINRVYNAVTTTANSLKVFTVKVDASDSSTPPEEIFVRVMVGNNTNLIEIVTQSSATNCITNPNPRSGVTARITCYTNATEFTYTHELGHVFIERTGVTGSQTGNTTFYGLIQRPTTEGKLQASGQFIFGSRSYFVEVPPPAPTPTYVLPYPSDWQRGDRGWGTGSDLPTPFAPSYNDVKPAYEVETKIPLPTEIYLGPCVAGGSTGTRGLPTQFQQNPCHVKDWVIKNPGWYSTPVPNLGPILETEIEETAADMFLNWIYSGFVDKVWTNRTSNLDDQIRSGDTRSDWMNCALTRLFNLKGFWKTSNVVFDFPATEDFECQRFPGLLAYD